MENQLSLKKVKRKKIFKLLVISLLILDGILILLVIIFASIGILDRFFWPLVPVLEISLVITAIPAIILFLSKRDERRAKRPVDTNKQEKKPRTKLYVVICSCMVVIAIVLLSLSGPEIICADMACVLPMGISALMLVVSVITLAIIGIRFYQKRKASLDIQKI